jgi:predicted kinase
MTTPGDPLPPEVVILIGLPASGKSSFFRERFSASHVHVSKDNFPKHRQPAKRQEREIREALQAGQSVVVDNTNVSPEERAAVITIAREFGAWVAGYRFPPDVRACRERNQKRESTARVPVVALYTAAKRYREPTLAEGFDELWSVHLTEAGFEVQEWNEDEPE